MSTPLILALIATMAGTLMLRLAWRAGTQQAAPATHLGLRWGGWLLLAASMPPWGMALGGDRGVATGLLVAMLAGLALVLHAGYANRRAPRHGRRAPRPDADEDTVQAGEGGNSVAARAWIFVLAGPLAAAAALALGMLLWLVLERAGVHGATVLTATVLFVPLAWALLATLATVELRLRLRSALVAAPLLLGAIGSALLSGAAA